MRACRSNHHIEMTTEIALYLAAIAILLFLSAFFNGTETALTAASRARMLALEEDGNHRAGLVNRLLSTPEKMIGTVLLGNTLVDVLASALAANLAVTLVGEVGVAYATAIMTILIVIFAAVLPKTYALAGPDRAALLLAPPMRIIILVLTPFTMAIAFLVRLFLKLTPNKLDDAANILARHEELRGTIEISQREGAMGKGDAHMLGGVLDLSQLQVGDIMVHRTKMETVNIAEPAARIVETVVSSQFSRVPVWRDKPENIVGVLHTKDMLGALSAIGWNLARLDIPTLLAQPWFVPEQTTVKAQLNAFLKRRAQIALVVDEYGDVQGLITLEDILEEIVGQIADEHDTPDATIRSQPDGAVLVDGTVTVRDLNRHMDWDLPDEEANTVAGLVIHEAQAIPEAGHSFNFHGYRFEIIRKQRNRITALRVKPLENANGKAEMEPGSG
jgi:Mg2+/Co2+ transporter CorB